MAALFGKKKEVEKKQEATDSAVVETKTPENTTVVDGGEDLAHVLAHPRITEKATLGTANSVYVFDVSPRANKRQIKAAVKLVYNVEPVKVHVTSIPSKNVRSMRTGVKGVKSGGKKAYVYLKKGDTISIM